MKSLEGAFIIVYNLRKCFAMIMKTKQNLIELYEPA